MEICAGQGIGSRHAERYRWSSPVLNVDCSSTGQSTRWHCICHGQIGAQTDEAAEGKVRLEGIRKRGGLEGGGKGGKVDGGGPGGDETPGDGRVMGAVRL